MSRILSSNDTTPALESTVFPSPLYRESIFTGHELTPSGFPSARPREAVAVWIPAVLIACFILLAWVRVFDYQRFRQVLLAPFSKRFMHQLTREGNLFRERISIALGIVYLLTYALFLFEFNEQILGFSFPEAAGGWLFIVIILVFTVFTAVKVAVVRLLGIIFRTRETTDDYLLNTLILALVSGPFLLASLVLIVYIKSAIPVMICAAVFSLLILFRFIRGFFIGLELRKFSYLFLFVYLCTLEFLPLLALVKILIDQSQSKGV